MSHVVKGELIVKDLDCLASACEARGLELMRGQESYRWYQGESQCDHAIRYTGDGRNYEIGLKAREDGQGFDMLWDPFDHELEKRAGLDMGALKQEYTAAVASKHFSRNGYRVQRRQLENGAIEITANR